MFGVRPLSPLPALYSKRVIGSIIKVIGGPEKWDLWYPNSIHT